MTKIVQKEKERRKITKNKAANIKHKKTTTTHGNKTKTKTEKKIANKQFIMYT